MFESYHKIEEKWANITPAHYQQIDKTIWIVTEKIHGANFCVFWQNAQIKFGKRKEVLAENEPFFNYENAILPILDRLENLYQEVKILTNSDGVFIYGELFGGGYPHAEVAPIQEVDLIQTGIYYCPDVAFFIFDIKFESDAKSTYLDFEKMSFLCEKYGLNYSKALFKGSFKDCTEFDNDFESTIPSILQLPILPFENKAEGVVIKPFREIILKTEKGDFRPILKRKIEKFSEVQYQQAEKQDGFSPKGRLLEYLHQVLSLVNQNCLQNAISKVGKAKKEFIKTEFTKDILAEINQNYQKNYQKLTKKEQAQADIILQKTIAKCLSLI